MNLRLNGHNATVCFQNPEMFHQSIFQSPPFRPGTTRRAHGSLWWSQSHPNSQSGALRRRYWSWRWLEMLVLGRFPPWLGVKKKTPQSHAGRRNSIWPLGKEHLEPMGGLSGVTGLDYNWTATWPAPHCWQASLCHAHGAAKVEATKSGGNATLSNGKMDMATSWLCPKMVSMASRLLHLH